MRKEIEIYGPHLITIEDVLTEIGKLLDFPSYYRSDLDSLYDFLTTYIDPHLTIRWHNTKEAQLNLGQDFNRVVEVLERVQALNPHFIYLLS